MDITIVVSFFWGSTLWLEKREEWRLLMGLEDEGKPVDNVKNEEKYGKCLQEKLINPEII